MKNKIIKLDRHISIIPKEELADKLGELKNSELVRSIIMNEKEYGTCNYNRTLRSLWYSTVKPALDKLGKLSVDDNSESKISAWDHLLSKYMAELVAEGKLTYQDLHIIDESRKRNVGYHGNNNVVVCVEKDTTYGIIEDISSLLGCSAYSSKGLSSLGAMESLIRDISIHKHHENIYFLIMSDYDPAGINIANTIGEQAKTVVDSVLKVPCEITTERIGINPDQLTEEELHNNWYSPKGDMKKWVEETGGIFGEAKGLELDAFTPDRIRDIFSTSLKNYIRTEDYIEDKKREFLSSKIRKSTDKYIDVIIDQIMAEKISDVNIDDFDILDYVRKGYIWLPDSLCHLGTDNIDELVHEKIGA